MPRTFIVEGKKKKTTVPTESQKDSDLDFPGSSVPTGPKGRGLGLDPLNSESVPSVALPLRGPSLGTSCLFDSDPPKATKLICQNSGDI